MESHNQRCRGYCPCPVRSLDHIEGLSNLNLHLLGIGCHQSEGRAVIRINTGVLCARDIQC